MNEEQTDGASRRDKIDRRLADAQNDTIRRRLDAALDGRRADDIDIAESHELANAVVHYINACALRGIAP